jgi:putative transposase
MRSTIVLERHSAGEHPLKPLTSIYCQFSKLVLRRLIEFTQFRAKSFVRVLRNKQLVGSMGRVASAGDNAAMESFNSLLQNNVLDTRRWATREDLHLAIVTWIERTYHRRRRQRALGKMTPIEFEALDLALKAA